MIKKSVPSYFKKRRDDFMKKAGNAALVVASNPVFRRNHDVNYPFRQDTNFYYLTGFDEENSFLVLTPSKGKGGHHSILFVQDRNLEREIWDGERYGVERAGEIFGIDEVYSVSSFDQELPKILQSIEKVYIQLGIHQVSDQRLVNLVKQATDRLGRTGKSTLTIVDPSSIIGEMRLFKTQDEVEIMRKVCSITAKAHMQLIKDIRPGMNEAEAEAIIDFNFRKNGCSRNGYGSIVAGGANATCLHYVKNNEVMNDGTLLLVDAGGEYDYYSADITRVAPVGRSFTREQARVYDAVLKVQKDCVAMLKPGVRYDDLQNRAREGLVHELLELGLLKGEPKKLLETKAYHRFYPHNIGHWLGMEVHDTGLYRDGESSRAFEEGMVVTVEPGLYIQPYDTEAPEGYRGIGVRIEDDILITKTGHENLTHEALKERSAIEELRQY
ncbi:MAG: aminopeptidase P N-terminal domain-containing protein [Proteobacteria bacterium]|jgi:Xaa-Pro aminopeptidase|nr:aminopeptidase P N-terminal domain-containing protein [Pseudomonadota bacterium]